MMAGAGQEVHPEANARGVGHMQQKDVGPDDVPDWKVIEEGLLNRVRGVARRIVERVRKTIKDTSADRGPDNPTNEAPATS